MRRASSSIAQGGSSTDKYYKINNSQDGARGAVGYTERMPGITIFQWPTLRVRVSYVLNRMGLIIRVSFRRTFLR